MSILNHIFNQRKTGISRVNRIINRNDTEYLNLVNRVLTNGEIKNGRNSKVISSFGEKMEFNLRGYTVPVLTTKHVAWKSCLKELLWFIKGDTNNGNLAKQGVKIWNDNASLEFKKSIGIDYKNEGDLGPIYGHQWRFFNAEYSGCDNSYKNEGVDQLNNIITNLRDPNERYSRRLVMSAWNPCQLEEMVLPPCHVLSQFNVSQYGELSCALYQRSGDIGLGIPFNIASYSFLTCLLAKHCGLKPGKFVHFIGDAHIYVNHIESLKQQQKNIPYLPPILEIKKEENIDNYTFNNFKLLNYHHNPKIHMEMVA
jgi:thymidylate synthase